MLAGFCPPFVPARVPSRYFAFVLLFALVSPFSSEAQVCNDHSYVSLDETCSALLNPDMVLEGAQPPGAEMVLTLTTSSGLPVPNPVGPAQLGQTLIATVTDINTGSFCQGLLTIEDKLPPKLTCFDITLPCAISNYTPSYLYSTLNLAAAYPAVSENCGPFSLTFSDTWYDLGCNDPADRSAYVKRIWTATDTSGNSASCTQYLYFDRLHAADITFPADVTISCANPQTAPAQTGLPYILAFGQKFALYPNSAYCELGLEYADQVIPVCDGTDKILRTWTLFDWCAPFGGQPPFTNPYTYIQIIKVTDNIGPVFSCPADTTLSANPFECTRDFDLPDFIISDQCSRINKVRAEWTSVDGITHVINGTLNDFPNNNLWSPDTLAVLGVAGDLPIGVVEMRFIATDDCGNATTCTMNITVVDSVPPVAVCQQITQVSIGYNGMALVNAASFNAGSFDNCLPVHFKARRLLVNGCQSEEYFYDQVKFCCEDIGDTIGIVLRVYDLPIDTGAVGFDYLSGHTSDCYVSALVEDKIKPVCIPAPDAVVSCEFFDPTLNQYGMAQGADNCCLDTVFLSNTNYTLFDTLCNRGTITRTFRAFDCSGNSGMCTQKVYVDYHQSYSIKFPDDLLVYTCDTTGSYPPGPQIFGQDCELIGITFEDQPFQATPGACFKIERIWKVINWCTYNPNLPFINVPNPTVSNEHNSPLNLPGPTVAPMGGNPPPTITKVFPDDVVLTNYSIYWSADANGYIYKQIITVADEELPKIRSCPLLDPIPVCDKSYNDPGLWNAPYYNDPLIPGSHDLCEAYVDLALAANDACTQGNVNIRYLLFLDLDNDGVQETVVNSAELPPPNTLYYGNAFNPNYTGGTPIQFDQRLVPLGQKYRFAVQIVPSFFRSARLRWNTLDSPEVFIQPQLPHGLHRIIWIVEDGCGNQDVCDYGVLITDCKPPTVFCYNGLSVNIMPTGMVTLWDDDFVLYGEDNCTPEPYLDYAIRKADGQTGFPVDPAGNPIENVTFTCDELGTQSVEIWAQDAHGNADYCLTYVNIQDPFGNCLPPAPLSAAGVLQTEPLGGNQGIDEAGVELSGSAPGQQSFNVYDLTDVNGLYLFGGIIPLNSDYTVTPLKDDNYMNGVSTFDLVLISKHIIGFTPLNSPYKMIAADINKSNSVTSFDIIELRKLILGIYTEFPQNTSWRFIDKDFVFTQMDNPFSSVPFAENISVQAAQTTYTDLDFIGIKIGDVNNSVIANAQDLPVDERDSHEPVLFDVSDRSLNRGDVAEVTFSSSAQLAGYQFTLLFEGLELLAIEPGPGQSADHFGVFGQAVTVSDENGNAQFTLKFKATRSGWLRDMVRVSGQITAAEAYVTEPQLATRRVGLRFENPEGTVVKGLDFEVYQNQPNPFAGKTRIGFYLPSSGMVTLSLVDMTGKTLMEQTASFDQGYNYWSVETEAEGALYYRLSSECGSETHTMLRVP